MKGLLLKDLYVCRKTLWVYLLMMGIFAVAQGEGGIIFTLFYAISIPINLISIDERDHFDRMLSAMPVGRVAAVLDKYIFSWGAIGVSLVFYIARRMLLGVHLVLSGHTMLFGIAIALAAQAVMLPLIFRFGVERGRLLYIAVIFVQAVLLGAVGQMWDHVFIFAPQAVTPVALGIALALSAVSVAVSSRVFEKRCTE